MRLVMLIRLGVSLEVDGLCVMYFTIDILDELKARDDCR